MEAVCQALVDDVDVKLQHVTGWLTHHPEVLACSDEAIRKRVSVLTIALQAHAG